MLESLQKEFEALVTRSDLSRQLARKLRFTRSALKGLTRAERDLFEERASALRSRLDSTARLFTKRGDKSVDEFFFSQESLPLTGKEYWFLDFVSTKGDRKQLILTFGRSEAETRVNGKRVCCGKHAAVAWAFVDAKRKLFDEVAEVSVKPGSISSKKFCFSGAFPHYELHVGKRTHLQLTAAKRGRAREKLSFFVRGLGLGLANLFLDFRGELEGTPFEGRCYVQKVVAVVPFLPWNWVRVAFRDGSTLDYFTPKLGFSKAGYEFRRRGRYYHAPSGKSFELRDLRIKRLPGGQWLLEGEGFNALFEEYASEPFKFEGIGGFRYDEYFVECTSLYYKGRVNSGGAGIIEDAYGLML
ncbi:MAG: hypothetical protein WC607_02440 [Candidatus Micrarchaeia archaeon]